MASFDTICKTLKSINMKKLQIFSVYVDSLTMAFKNVLSLLGAIVLWVLTIWIPYINVGTTIGLLALPLELSRGHIISPLAIFKPVYRKRMGEVFIYFAIYYSAVFAGFLFGVIPGIVISFAFSMGIYIMLDHKVNPIEALTVSNELTYGNKWRMFFINLLVGLTVGILSGIVGWIPVVGFVFTIIFALIGMAWSLSLNAVYYRELVGGEQPLA